MLTVRYGTVRSPTAHLKLHTHVGIHSLAAVLCALICSAASLISLPILRSESRKGHGLLSTIFSHRRILSAVRIRQISTIYLIMIGIKRFILLILVKRINENATEETRAGDWSGMQEVTDSTRCVDGHLH